MTRNDTGWTTQNRAGIVAGRGLAVARHLEALVASRLAYGTAVARSPGQEEKVRAGQHSLLSADQGGPDMLLSEQAGAVTNLADVS